MKRHIVLGVCAGAVVAVASTAAVVVQSAASGAVQETFTIAAPTLVPVVGSTHNGSLSPVCGTTVGSVAASERNGTSQDGAGSFEGAVQLPQGVTIKSLRLTAHDFTDPGDVHVYLARKSAQPQTSFVGRYTVLASTSSSGAVDSARRFTTTSVNNA